MRTIKEIANHYFWHPCHKGKEGKRGEEDQSGEKGRVNKKGKREERGDEEVEGTDEGNKITLRIEINKISVMRVSLIRHMLIA